ncbi:MAG: adenylyltransferase/cytidyltransferase family protein [Patescibacteria group bacterium]|nr:MAG: adenylyltransferase/cytidyltransferase family protein [Patescibacteria group bacterium]
MPKAIAFGTFDGFHPGHKFYLDAAASHGDLTVVVARDATVEKVKGRAPRRNEDARLADLIAAGYNAILGSTGDKYAILSEMKPDVICLGYDQEAFTEKLPVVLAERGLKAEIIRLSAFQPETYKSSLLNR